MKKVLRGICLMGVVALLATSCNKNSDKVTTIQTVNQRMEEIAFDYNGEKVYLDNTVNKLYFEEGDIMTLFGVDEETGNYATAPYVPTAGTYVDNTTWTPATSSSFNLPNYDLYAFCPGGDEYVIPDMANEFRATFKIPATQIYRPNTMPKEGFFMASKINKGYTPDQHFFFRNICGALRLRLYSPNDRVVTSIVVEDKQFHLSGDVNLKINKVNPTTLTNLFNDYNPTNMTYMNSLQEYINESGYNVTNAGMTMTLDCGAGAPIGTTKAEATSFYITLRPLALSNGCTITINFTEGDPYIINSNKNNVVSPNVIRSMSAINVH